MLISCDCCYCTTCRTPRGSKSAGRKATTQTYSLACCEPCLTVYQPSDISAQVLQKPLDCGVEGHWGQYGSCAGKPGSDAVGVWQISNSA